MLTITLSAAEAEALTSEKLNDKETFEAIIHRLIEPLVVRLATDHFKRFVTAYTPGATR